MSERPDMLDGAIAPEANTVLFGHDEAQAFLAESYRGGRLHHAILIEGPEGIGKATLAFRFANHLISNPKPATAPARIGDPDPGSAVSRQIASGASHNILHIRRPFDEKTGKMKSVITVDEVRRVGHFFSQTAGSDNWRIAVIDAADHMNRNAANALLKILEEPPKNSLFLVLSHAPGRLLPTIRSRCLGLSLGSLGKTDIGAVLDHLGVRFDLDSGYQATEGSVARALVMANYGGVEIAATFDSLMDRSAVGDRAEIHKLAQVLSAKDRDVAYHFFVDHVINRVRRYSAHLAVEGRGREAAMEAERASAVAAHFERAETYNLDRGQAIINLFSILLD